MQLCPARPAVPQGRRYRRAALPWAGSRTVARALAARASSGLTPRNPDFPAAQPRGLLAPDTSNTEPNKPSPPGVMAVRTITKPSPAHRDTPGVPDHLA